MGKPSAEGRRKVYYRKHAIVASISDIVILRWRRLPKISLRERKGEENDGGLCIRIHVYIYAKRGTISLENLHGRVCFPLARRRISGNGGQLVVLKDSGARPLLAFVLARSAGNRSICEVPPETARFELCPVVFLIPFVSYLANLSK